jgi:hypothetical protein
LFEFASMTIDFTGTINLLVEAQPKRPHNQLVILESLIASCVDTAPKFPSATIHRLHIR